MLTPRVRILTACLVLVAAVWTSLRFSSVMKTNAMEISSPTDFQDAPNTGTNAPRCAGTDVLSSDHQKCLWSHECDQQCTHQVPRRSQACMRSLSLPGHQIPQT